MPEPAHAFQIKKNLLDIEERTYRNYFLTSIIVSLSIISILVGLSAVAYERYASLLLLGTLLPIYLLFKALDLKKRADEKIESIRCL